MHRRTFFTAALGAAATPALSAASAPGQTSEPPSLIDTNVSLSHWVVRNSWAETPASLVAKLRHHGVTSAWVGSLDGVLHTDIAAVNSRLATACEREGAGVLRAFGTINPTLPDWEDDVRRCHELHRMPGIRVYPNYHGYELNDPRFARLLVIAAQRALLVQIMLVIEDDRSQNPALTAAPVRPGALLEVLPQAPGVRVMLLNSGSRVLGGNAALVQRLAAAGVWFEIATLETVAGIEALLRRAPDARLCFGSHSPYFYFEAALLKLRESALSRDQLAAVAHLNARAALASA
jgi:predicted TIM-barrel fold metal-dependent hydrolase